MRPDRLLGRGDGSGGGRPALAGRAEALQTLVIIVAGPVHAHPIAMCVSLMKSLREEPDISLIPPQERNLAREYLVTRSERPTPPPEPGPEAPRA